MNSDFEIEDLVWHQAPFAVVDVEGNGDNPHDLVEIGVVQINDGVPKPVASWLMRPLSPITGLATRIHGITNDAVASAPTFEMVQSQIAAQIDKRYLVAHNAAIDWKILKRKLSSLTPPAVIDTLKLARALCPRVRSFKLNNLAAEFDIAPPAIGHPHRAGYDAAVTASVFICLARNASPAPLLLRDLLRLGKIEVTLEERQGRLF